MKFLSNENFPYPSIHILRNVGHIVLSITDEFPGISDDEVIRIAKDKQLTILTFDKDYGELIFKQKINNPPAVIFFRFKGFEPNFAGNLLVDLINNREIIFMNKFTVIEEKGIRQKTYQFSH